MDQGAGRSNVALAKGIGLLWPAQFALILEADYGAYRDPRAIRGAAGIMEADIIELGPHRQVGQNPDINAAANAIGEIVRGAAATAVADIQMRAAREELNKRSELGRVMHDDTRAEHICVGIKGNAAGRSVIAAEVPDDAQVGDRLIGDRTADAILVEVCAAAEVKVGIADGSVEVGLGM